MFPRLGFTIPIMGKKKPAHPAEEKRPSSLADALFSKAQQRVLGVLFGNPDRSFFAIEVIALAGTGTGAVQRELTKLAATGLVTVKRMGRQKHYQANPAAPVFAELRGLVVKTSGVADVVCAGLSPLRPVAWQALQLASTSACPRASALRAAASPCEPHAESRAAHAARQMTRIIG